MESGPYVEYADGSRTYFDTIGQAITHASDEVAGACVGSIGVVFKEMQGFPASTRSIRKWAIAGRKRRKGSRYIRNGGVRR
jgi:hypothetical protein